MLLLSSEAEIPSGIDTVLKFEKYAFYHPMEIVKNLFLGALLFM